MASVHQVIGSASGARLAGRARYSPGEKVPDSGEPGPARAPPTRFNRDVSPLKRFITNVSETSGAACDPERSIKHLKSLRNGHWERSQDHSSRHRGVEISGTC